MCCETCGSSDYKCGCEPVTIWVSNEALKQTVAEHYVSKSDLRKLAEELHTEADDPNLHLLVAHAFKDVADRIEKLIKRGE